MDPEPFELELYDFEKMTMQALDERNHFKICVIHAGLLAAMTRMLTAVCKFIVSNFIVGFAD